MVTHTPNQLMSSVLYVAQVWWHTPNQLMSSLLYAAQVWWHTHLITWCHRCCMWPKYGDTHTPNQLMSSVLYVAQVWRHTPNHLMSSVLYVAQVWWHTHLVNWCHRCCMWPKYGDTHTKSTDVISAVCGPSMVTHTPNHLMSSVLYVAQVWWHTHLINWCPGHQCCMWPKYGDTHLINWCHQCCMWPKYGDTHTKSTDVISAVCGPSMVTHTPNHLMSSVLYVAQVWWHTHIINWCHRCCMWPKYGDTHT